MLSFDEAQMLFADIVEPLSESEQILLSLANGRVLAQDLLTNSGYLLVDKSAIDGYAIRSADHWSGRSFPVQQVCNVGIEPQPLLVGHAIRVFAGSLLPRDADTIIPDDHVLTIGEGIRVVVDLQLGGHIRQRGEGTREGELLAAAGTVLGPGHIAALASQGIDYPRVIRLAEVALLSWGEGEVVSQASSGRNGVGNVNGPMLESLVESLGAIVRGRRQVPADELALQDALLELADEADIVVVCGGAEGASDRAGPALVSAGGDLLFCNVSLNSGKPVSVGRLRGKPIVCLPGNPIEAFTIFVLLVTPMLRKLQGRAEICPPVLQARVDIAATGGSHGDVLLRATSMTATAEQERVRIYVEEESASISALGGVSGFVRVMPQSAIQQNDLLPYYDLARWLY